MTGNFRTWADIPPAMRGGMDQELAAYRQAVNDIVEVVAAAIVELRDPTRIVSGYLHQLDQFDHSKLAAVCAVALLQLAERK